MSTDIARSHRANGSTSSSHSRASSSRSSSGRPTPQVESAVTRLLVAIKQLLEALTDWSTGKLTETQVSDVYVQLGNDFNTCVIAFAAFDIDMRELRGVPEDLRNVLETALAEDATPETLERFLPEVRKIITGLLQGLRTKQTLFRQTVADRAQRRAERQSSSSSSQRSGRSGSRPLPPPRIPEESRTISPPPLTSPPPSQATQAMTKVVASAVPERMSISSRRKLSASGSQTGQRAQSPRATGSDSEGSGNIRFVGGFATQRPPSIPIPTPPAGDGLADLVANASAAEERLRSPRLRRLPLPPGTTVNLSGIISDKDEPPDVQTASGRSSVTLTQDLTVTPPRHSAPLPAISPDVKRYSLSDKPVSPPSRATNSTAPAVNIEQASPSPPSIATERMEGLTTPSPPPPSESTLDPSPAVERSLAALQQSEVLARKASKRFSTYTFSKITGTSAGLAANTMPGGSKPMVSSKSIHRRSIAPSASVGQLSSKDLEALAEVDEPSSPISATANKLTRGKGLDDVGSRRGKSPSPDQDIPPVPPVPKDVATMGRIAATEKPLMLDTLTTRPTANGIVDDQAAKPATPTPQPMKLFLQVSRNVKKVTIDPDTPLSFASLRVLFVDKFTYNPGQDNFPTIYIRDPKSGVQYELEDIDEVQDGCLLSLNIEPLDQVKQHIDLQMSTLSNEIRELKSSINSQKRQSLVLPPVVPDSPPVTPQPIRPSDQQLQLLARRLSKLRPDDANKLSVADSTPRPPMQPLVEQPTGGTIQTLAPQSTGGSSFTFASESGTTTRIVNDLKSQFDEIQNLRRDLGVMRQLYVDFIAQTKDSLGTLRTQAATVRDLANAKVGGARAYIDSGKTKLDSRTQTVLTKIEELQDMVEGLKEDVLKRHVSPKSSVMKTLTTDVEATRAELAALQEHINTIKPMWKKTWEEELQNIVEEQQFLTHQEEFIEDLLEDHKALTEVFGHVEKVMTIRNTTMTASGGGKGGRIMRTGRQFRPPAPEPGHDGLSTVMLEIRGAAVDPEKRMKAIEANQKARRKELMARSTEFQDELDEFVGRRKLRKTGGIEETERLRQARNDYALKNMFSPASGGVAGTMVGATGPGGPANGMGDGLGGGDSFGLSGLTFAKAPAADGDGADDDRMSFFSSGGGGFGSGLSGLTFTKAPAIPDSP